MARVGRNDLCPCGSGKKYKHCCESTSKQYVQKRTFLTDVTRQYLSQGQRYQSEGNYDEAIVAFRSALTIQPESGLIYAMLGSALHSKGDCDNAIESLLTALSIEPDIAAAHNDLGLVYQSKGQLYQAIAYFRTALKVESDLFPAHMNLGRALQLDGQNKAAIQHYRDAIEYSPDYFQAHHNLGVALEAVGQVTEAAVSYKKALELKPSLLESQIGLERLLGQLVPIWHMPMMNDKPRNDAYYNALRLAVTPESRVFEIGTGSGLLSLMAAQLGAETIVTCEAESIIADAARRVIDANGFSEKITVLSSRSTDVVVGRDLPEPADILVQEIFSSELLSEGVLSSIEDAKQRLLKPGCKMIPAKASIMIALFGGEEIESNLFVNEVRGLKLQEFNNIIPKRQLVYRNDLDINILSEELEVFKFDFANESKWEPAEETFRINIKKGGRCLGIVQWIRLYFNNDILFENHPNTKAAATSWPPCVYLNVSPMSIKEKQTATVLASHDKVLPFFWLQSIK